MGLAQIYAGYTANYGELNIFNRRSIVLSKTNATDSYITDSGGGGTAMATGKKTNNRFIGVDATGNSLTQLPLVLKGKRKSIGIITSGDVTDATPAAFYAYNKERDSSYAIAKDFMSSGKENFVRANDTLFKCYA